MCVSVRVRVCVCYRRLICVGSLDSQSHQSYFYLILYTYIYTVIAAVIDLNTLALFLRYVY